MAGVEVLAGDKTLTSDERGEVRLNAADQPTLLTVQRASYEPMFGQLDRNSDADQAVALRPTSVEGTVTDQASGAPIPNAKVSAVSNAGPNPTTATTGADGGYLLSNVPPDARLHVDAGDYGVIEEPVGERTRVDFQLRLSVVTGAVTGTDGTPIAGAIVTAGDAKAVTGADGTYRLTGVPDTAEVVVSAPGFEDQRAAIPADRVVNAALASQQINALYANLGVLSDPGRLDELIAIADQTEINALVVDVKQDTIYYDTQVQFFQDIEGMVTPVLDPAELLAKLDEHGIYAIARMVVFKDPVAAEGRPDLAVKDEVTGDLWRDYEGAAWVNAFNQELWEANADLAAELGNLGFDEVQYDYIRFPSDGDLTTADFGPDYSEEARRAAIRGAVALGAERVKETGAKFAIDLFPIIALMGDDQGIGQTLQDLTPLVDYVCLMVYPSHYTEGNIPVGGHPNDYPAETVTYTLEKAEELVRGSMRKMRPWLQDFTYPAEGFSEYGPAEVRAQIDAAEALGVSGWMLWNAAADYQVDALKPQS